MSEVPFGIGPKHRPQGRGVSIDSDIGGRGAGRDRNVPGGEGREKRRVIARQAHHGRIARCPSQARYRLPGRLNAWIVCVSPTTRLSMLVLRGIPAALRKSAARYFCPRFQFRFVRRIVFRIVISAGFDYHLSRSM
jgi:hypothetical protein